MLEDRKKGPLCTKSFWKNNWLPVNNGVEQCMIVTTYSLKNKNSFKNKTPNSFPLLKNRSVYSFVEPIYVKEILGNQNHNFY